MTRRQRTLGGDPALDLFGFGEVPPAAAAAAATVAGSDGMHAVADDGGRANAEGAAAAPSRGRRRKGPAPAGTADDGVGAARYDRRVAEAATEFSPSRSSLDESIPGASPASAVSIAALTTTARDVIEGAFVPLWVRGEVSDFKSHRNGHWYFCLRDDSAQIKCVVWSRDRRNMPAPPDDGMQVVALGQLTVYAARGDMQFAVHAMDAQGDGLWRKALEITRAALDAEGLLAPDRKRPIPRFPRRIAIVTSPDGAALHDIVSVARRRFASVELVVVPAKVQGEGAPEELCAALDTVGRWGEVDVVIVGRGGGGREDLWAFNDIRVARAIARCAVPVISAVGHEVDVTIADLVADLRAATPSAAAEAAVPVRAELAAYVAALAESLGATSTRQVERKRRSLDRAARDVAAAGRAHAERKRTRMQTAAARLDALSPLSTLARGYAVARGSEGETLASARDFSPGMSFGLLLRDGAVRATADAVERGTAGRPRVR